MTQSELRGLQAELEQTAEQLRTSTVSYTRLKLREILTRLEKAILTLENEDSV